MSEENEVKAEPVPQKQLGYDQNAAIANRLSQLDCEAGEAILAIKINVSADSEGTKIGIGVKKIVPKAENVRSITAGLLTMMANNIAMAIQDKVKELVSEDFTRPILVQTEKELAEIFHNRPDGNEAEKPEEVPHGV